MKDGTYDGSEAQNALNRMARASKRGTGCHLTAEMIQALHLTFIGEMWAEPDPRKTNTPAA